MQPANGRATCESAVSAAADATAALRRLGRRSVVACGQQQQVAGLMPIQSALPSAPRQTPAGSAAAARPARDRPTGSLPVTGSRPCDPTASIAPAPGRCGGGAADTFSETIEKRVEIVVFDDIICADSDACGCTRPDAARFAAAGPSCRSPFRRTRSTWPARLGCRTFCPRPDDRCWRCNGP